MSKSPLKGYPSIIDDTRTAKKRIEYLHSTYRNPYDDHTDRVVGELQLKLDVALKQNTHLLDENSMLTEMVNKLRFEYKGAQEQIAVLQQTIDEQMLTGQGERSKLMEELAVKQKLHEG